MATSRPKTPPPKSSGAGGGASGGGAASTRPRILRIGILLGGKIVEERLIRERTSVSIGQSMRNTFSIPVEGLPLEFSLFSLDERGRYHLHFLEKMDGRLSDGAGQVATLDALKREGAAKSGDHWSVALGDSSRGKLSLSDLTILFQIVAEPPRQPKPMLPASVRGTFADRFDPRLSVIMAASVILHFAVVILALLGDIEETSIAAKAYNLTFQPEKYAVTLEEEKPVQQPEQTAGSGAGSAVAEKKPDQPAAPKPAKGDGGERSEDKDVGMSQEDVEAMANLMTGEGTNGTSEGDMSSRRPQGDLKGEIAAINEGNRTVAIGGGANRGSRDGGGTRVGTGSGPRINGPTGPESAGGGKVAEQGPSGRITVASRTGSDDSSLSPDAVLDKIKKVYMNAITRCYTQYLKKEATSRGAVALSFTVNETGRLVNGDAKGFAGEVDQCIEGNMGSWRFPVPRDKDNSPTDANFVITLQLVPD
ncbi:MAG TPA: AgmX/PglI C-terminal domain-containing protein [Kofleriaceae bacterium]|nr:AgmX/PglI C-terminal domain-containing protein [Kofleriaceae bacterium]